MADDRTQTVKPATYDQTYSITDQIACIERELGMRRVVYPRRVAISSMTQKNADREIATMQCVLDTLRKAGK
jgi:hypothetical protein